MSLASDVCRIVGHELKHIAGQLHQCKRCKLHAKHRGGHPPCIDYEDGNNFGSINSY